MDGKGVTRKKRIYIFILIAFLIVAGTIYTYIVNLNQTVADTNIAHMKELSSHDSKAIENYLDNVWKEMDAVVERLRLYDCRTTEDTQIRLNLEKTSLDFDEIYLLDDNGTMYTASFIISDADEEILQCFRDHPKRFAHRTNGRRSKHVESQREALMFGIGIDDLQIDGVTYLGIVVQSEINVIQNSLKIDSYDGRGYSSVIDYEGNYIVNINRVSSMGKQGNFFEQLSDGVIAGGRTVDDVKALITRKDGFTMSYETQEGDSRILTVIPLDKADWLFIMDLSGEVFKEQSQELIMMATVMAGIVAVIFFALVRLIYRQSIAAIRSKAEIQAKSDFLSGMSHEIRTPLNGLVGLNHLMKANIDNRKQLMGYIEKSADTARYLLSLVNDILDMSKLQSGHFEMSDAPFCLEQMLDNVLSMQRENISNHGIQLEIHKDLKAVNIIGDELRIKQVLMNILSNAVKFTPEGGSIRLDAGQEVSGTDEVRTIVRITDTGIGISEEFQKVIFNSFTQEGRRKSESQKGTGLGMAISYMLMKQMHGDIRVESRLGSGSTFTIEFPAVITDEASSMEEAELPAAENGAGKTGNLNILLAEDNELNAEILTEILRMQDFEVTHVKNGREAVDAFQKSAVGGYDVILMDVQMPLMDGYEATRIIRRMKRADAGQVMIFACTANAFKEDQVRALESGMNDFLPKPIDVKLLLQKMRKIMR